MEEETSLDFLEHHAPQRCHETFLKADRHCRDIVEKVSTISDAFIAEEGLAPEGIAIVLVGSVGRGEALAASDLDLLPITRAERDLSEYQEQRLRARIRQELEVAVSKGEELTKRCALDQLSDQASIGGTRDDSTSLTRRVLVLTESVRAGGALALAEIREAVLNAYASHEASGRHLLALCNDIARYYRTLCVDYKAKVDGEAKSWCSRNAKLRHSRKVWYTASILSLVAAAERGSDKERTIRALLDEFSRPPYDRLARAAHKLNPASSAAVAEVLSSYSWFLEFMSKPENRAALDEVQHEERYANDLTNPFPAVKFNSDVLHERIVALFDGLPRGHRDRVLRWFLL